MNTNISYSLGEYVWFWYEDDGCDSIGDGYIAAFSADGWTVTIQYDSWIDLQENETGPYTVRQVVPFDHLCLTRDVALECVAERAKAKALQAYNDYIDQNIEAMDKARSRIDIAAFPYKAGDDLYAVVPFAMHSHIEIWHGNVETTPSSKYPTQFQMRVLSDESLRMAPCAYVGKTAEEAVNAYTKARAEEILKQYKEKS